MKKFVCSVCGYVHTAEALDADFRCPVCKGGKIAENSHVWQEMPFQTVVLRDFYLLCDFRCATIRKNMGAT